MKKAAVFVRVSTNKRTSNVVVTVTKTLANSKEEIQPSDVGAHLYLSLINVN